MRKIRKHKRILVFLLIMSFVVGIVPASDYVYATNAKDKKKDAEENLDRVNDEIDKINDDKQQVEQELANVRVELSNLLDAQAKLEVEIGETQAVIDQTKLELEAAREDAENQYQAMTLRIQYMYENSVNDSMLVMLLSANGITDFLNRVEYISTIYQTDRDLTEAYKHTVALVEEKEAQLAEKMDELLMQEEIFLAQQQEVEAMIASLEADKAEFAEQLAAAKKKAKEYEKTIAEQDKIIREEEERRRREEEERKRREEEERKKREEQEKNNQDDDDDVPTGNVTGQDIVNYALKFVGNPYVWGGNSLTNGCDCSGFVHLVYKKFGYKTARYSMSFLNNGVAVSRENIKPGDIVVYARHNGIGHVAIYMGNGKIVEAQSKNAGITSSRSVDCREIIGIRRIIR